MRVAKRLIGSMWVFVVAVGVFATASGVMVALKNHEVRLSFVRLGDIQGRHDKLLEEYSRLLLERGTLSSYQNVDELAEGVLSMHFPEDVTRIQQ